MTEEIKVRKKVCDFGDCSLYIETDLADSDCYYDREAIMQFEEIILACLKLYDSEKFEEFWSEKDQIIDNWRRDCLRKDEENKKLKSEVEYLIEQIKKMKGRKNV